MESAALVAGASGIARSQRQRTRHHSLSTEYDQAEDLARIDITAEPIAQPVETFDLATMPAGQGGVIKITWDKTQAVVPFTVQQRGWGVGRGCRGHSAPRSTFALQ